MEVRSVETIVRALNDSGTLKTLLSMKLAAARPQDLVDIRESQRIP
jgi:hypothetical protein